MDETLTYDIASSHISAYELERNLRKKALHDAVQKDLVDAGFVDATSLRSAFSGDGSEFVREDDSRRLVVFHEGNGRALLL